MKSPGLQIGGIFLAIIGGVEQGIQADGVEAFVGVPAIINTLRPGHRDALAFGNFSSDELEVVDYLPLLRSFPVAIHVVYWVRPVKAENPRIIGIIWLDNDKGHVFFGALYRR